MTRIREEEEGVKKLNPPSIFLVWMKLHSLN